MFNKTKRLVVVSDFHAGHIVGLTHPDFNPLERDRESPAFKLYRLREQYWKFYAKTLKDLQPIHALIVNGDCVDGKGAKSGGTELLTTDQGEQVDMAVAAIEEAKADKVYMSYGTAYHVSSGGDDWERQVANKVGAVAIGSHDWLNVNGLVFDYKHHCGSSSVPYGRHTAVAKERVWNMLWAAHQEYPRGDVFIRCLSEDTEILTDRGWMLWSNINMTDRVLTLNRASNRLEWNSIEAFTSRQSDHEMVSIKAKGYDVLVTPDHTMIYHPMSSNNWMAKEAQQLNTMNTFRLPVSGQLDSPGVDIEDGMLKLLAWVIAEGNMDAGNRSKGYSQKNNVRLFQRVSRANEVEAVIREAGIPYTKHLRKQIGQPIREDNGKVYYTRENTYVFYLRQPYSRQIIAMLDGEKNIPDWLMQMDSRQFGIFLDEYIRGDGYLEKGSRHQGKIYTANKDLADRLQILLLCNGYKTQISPRYKWNKVSYIIHFVKKQNIAIKRDRAFEIVPYEGLTWCVSVANGTLVTRRKGKVAIVGNSHVHYFGHCGGYGWLAMTTPALQGHGSKFGARRMSGTIDFGLIHFDVRGKDSWSWASHILKMRTSQQNVMKL